MLGPPCAWQRFSEMSLSLCWPWERRGGMWRGALAARHPPIKPLPLFLCSVLFLPIAEGRGRRCPPSPQKAFESKATHYLHTGAGLGRGARAVTPAVMGEPLGICLPNVCFPNVYPALLFAQAPAQTGAAQRWLSALGPAHASLGRDGTGLSPPQGAPRGAALHHPTSPSPTSMCLGKGCPYHHRGVTPQPWPRHQPHMATSHQEPPRSPRVGESPRDAPSQLHIPIPPDTGTQRAPHSLCREQRKKETPPPKPS